MRKNRENWVRWGYTTAQPTVIHHGLCVKYILGKHHYSLKTVGYGLYS